MQLKYRGLAYTTDECTMMDTIELSSTGSYRGNAVRFKTAQRTNQLTNTSTVMWRGHRALGVQ